MRNDTTAPTGRRKVPVLVTLFLVLGLTLAGGGLAIDTHTDTGSTAADALAMHQHGSPAGTDLGDANTKLLGESTNDTAGWSVAEAGDVNGDGLGDLLVGAPRNDSAGPNAGAAYVLTGSLSGDWALANADLTVTGDAAGDNLGFAVSSAGDHDDDGYDDVAVGAPLNDSSGANAGSVYVFHGTR